MNRRYLIYGLWIIAVIISFFLDDLFFKFIKIISNRTLDQIMILWSDYITGFVIFLLITLVFLFRKKDRELIVVLWLSFFISWLISLSIKGIVHRNRPSPMLVKEIGSSFPSNHSVVSFSSVKIMDKNFRIVNWMWFVFAIIVAFSRVYVNVHHLSDVMAGSLLGYFIGDIFSYIEYKYKFFRRFNPIKGNIYKN
jgi:undecaprenyl-diphosphatase